MDDPLPVEIDPKELEAADPVEGEEQKSVLTRSRSVFAAYSGPVPPPEILRQYDELVPGAAARILAQAEQQTSHRIYLEKKVIESDISRSWAGLICGFILAMTIIIGGCVLVAQDHDGAGATIATVGVASLVSVFVYGTSQRWQELQKKAKRVPAPESEEE